MCVCVCFWGGEHLQGSGTIAGVMSLGGGGRDRGWGSGGAALTFDSMSTSCFPLTQQHGRSLAETASQAAHSVAEQGKRKMEGADVRKVVLRPAAAAAADR